MLFQLTMTLIIILALVSSEGADTDYLVAYLQNVVDIFKFVIQIRRVSKNFSPV